MNSLRTDDILGAKPRVRHMPKNLIRERAIPTSFMTNLTLNNPQFEPVNRSQMYYQQEQPDSPIQYQNNDPNGYPFYARNRLTKESRYVNYDFPREQAKPYKEPAEINNINQSMHLNRAPSQHRYQSGSKLEEKRANQDSSRLEGRRQGEESERSRASSRKSMDNRESREQSKRIFRGLGFNIITNHKYEYTFEHKLPTNF